ncbi:hypothetical protein SMD44_08256 [Streptomyces alboflavus]|uniref:Uncharacterized protein n=1 Tax=Streptomyces alboflavus TaxID=67267 RepID=A0A1Z1WQU6_9ACTN|nr:hypothetical protein SMD44_08256 [Streptomyces alboflavus]
MPFREAEQFGDGLGGARHGVQVGAQPLGAFGERGSVRSRWTSWATRSPVASATWRSIPAP